MTKPTTDQEHVQHLDKILAKSSAEGRQRLATYLRRYMSPLTIVNLFEQHEIGVLTEEREIERATVIVADVRGFTPQTLLAERSRRGMRQVAELLERFFNDAMETVFEYGGVMGEFSGDRFIAVFGIPFPNDDDATRALLAAVDIYNSASGLNRPLRIAGRHHLDFEIGLGLHTGGPLWIGDIGAGWRRELTMIGTVINVASREEELTKTPEFISMPGYNIILTQTCVDSLSEDVRTNLEFAAFPPRPLRGLGEDEYQVLKLRGVKPGVRLPGYRWRIDSGIRATVDTIAQAVESVQEREDRGRLQQTMQDIGRAITSSLNLDDILESVLDEVQRFLNADTASLLLIEEGTGRLRFKAVRPKDRLDDLRSFEDKLVIGRGIVGHVAKEGKALILDDAQSDPHFYSQPDKKTGFQTRSVICTPISIAGTVIGVIQVIDEQPSRFMRDDLQTLESIAAFAASAIHNARQHEAVAEAETLAAMSVITSDIAHRIKNDVGLIKMVTNTLLKNTTDAGSPPPDVLQTKLQRIFQSANSTLNMMDEIRSPFSGVTLELVELRDVLEDTLAAALAGTPALQNVDIKRSYIELPRIVTDKKRLGHVFYKVIDNALDAMAAIETKTLIIDIWRPEQEPHRVRIGIADTGPGIPPERRAQIFRPGRQLEKDDSGKQGWGYGLWSSRLFLRAIGGTIVLDTVYREGTRMVIDLPMEAHLQTISETLVPEELASQ